MKATGGKQYLAVVLSAASTIAGITAAVAVGKPSLHGRVVLQTTTRTIPLQAAMVVVLSPETRRAVGKSYTDDRGNFALYGLRPTAHDLEVRLNGKVMKQQASNGVVERRRVVVAPGGTKLPDIAVRK